MADKLPPRFAPEGARFKRPDWAPEGSQADQQKRTYIDRISDLEGQIKRLTSEAAENRQEIASLKESEKGSRDDFLDLTVSHANTCRDFDSLKEDRKGDAGLIDALQANSSVLNDERLRLQAVVYQLKDERDDLRSRLDTMLNPPKRRWREYASKLPLAGSIQRYRKESYYRGQANSLMVMFGIASVIYFAIAGFVINQMDTEKPSFRSGGSYFYCGAVRGVLHPLQAGGAWLLGLGGDATTNTIDANASVAETNTQAEDALEAAADATPTPTPMPEPVYIPPPQGVIDPNAIVKDLADHVTAKATVLEWTPEQVSCVHRETIDAMRTVFVGGMGQSNREYRFDAAKGQFEGAAGRCNSDGKDALMNDMFYDDDNYFRKMQNRIESREFGDVWPR